MNMNNFQQNGGQTSAMNGMMNQQQQSMMNVNGASQMNGGAQFQNPMSNQNQFIN